MNRNTTFLNQEALVSLGKALKERRKSLGITQKELALVANVSVSLLSQIEAGKITTRISKLLDVLTMVELQFTLENGKNRIIVNDNLINEPLI